MLKAGLLTIVLLPDSARPELTFLGLLMSLSILELGRMTIETGCGAAGPAAKHRLRIAVTSIAVAIIVSIGISAWSHWDPANASTSAVQLPGMILGGLMDLSNGPVAGWLGWPLAPIADASTASSWNATAVGGITVAIFEIVGLIVVLLWLDQRTVKISLLHEQDRYAHLAAASSRSVRAGSRSHAFSERNNRLPPVPNGGGLGTLIARQALMLKGYWATVLVTLLIPAAMATFPLWTLPLDQPVLVHVVGSLLFYTLLLGPPALKIDFRRDPDRMMLLRLLPMSSMRVTIGQLALPVLACLSFQVLVLVVTMAARPVDPVSIVFAMLVLVPLTVFIFAMENAIFLNFPQRIGQEGIEVLIRTTLVFTFKSLLCVVGFALAIAWTFATRKLFGEAYQSLAYRTGGLLMLWSVAIGSLQLTASAFSRYDVSLDTPAD